MRNEILKNVSVESQDVLEARFSWLRSVAEKELNLPENVSHVSVSVFDHWLTRDEANELLTAVPAEVQHTRDLKHEAFCSLIRNSTRVLTFDFLSDAETPTFFEFTTAAGLADYCTPTGGKTLGQPHFQVVLPEYNCAFCEGWDDTNHFYFCDPEFFTTLQSWAAQSGLFLLVDPVGRRASK